MNVKATLRTAGVAAILCLALGNAPFVSGQARFETLTRDAIPAVPGLQVVTVRDNALNACYIVFVMEPRNTIGTVARVEPPDIRDAMQQLDRRLTELTTSFEQWRSEYPGTMAPNTLRYEAEVTRAQHAFDLTVISALFDRLGDRLDGLAAQTRLSATALPGPCVAAGAKPTP